MPGWLAPLVAALMTFVPAVREGPFPPLPTTTTPATSRCPQWYSVALDSGWLPEEWDQLDRIMWRESRCTADATHHNANGSTDYCLMQVNSVHRRWIADEYSATMADLLTDPGLCLRVARTLYERSGWSPWRATGG